jgi:hypothetical protein
VSEAIPTLVLSICQPWTLLAVLGFKDVENRTWPCPSKVIGRKILLHASKSERKTDIHAGHERAKRILPKSVFHSFLHKDRPRGGIVGMVTVVGCVRNSASPWADPGAWHWLFSDARSLPFIPCPGRLKLFTLEPQTQQKLEAVNV